MALQINFLATNASFFCLWICFFSAKSKLPGTLEFSYFPQNSGIFWAAHNKNYRSATAPLYVQWFECEPIQIIIYAFFDSNKHSKVIFVILKLIENEYC